MKKIVINNCYGGFSFSPEATLWLFNNGYDEEGFKAPVKDYFGEDIDANNILGYQTSLERWRDYVKNPTKKKGMLLIIFTPDEQYVLNNRPRKRDHELVVKCVEELGKKANGSCAKLKVVKIPNNVEYVIEEYDGSESIHETHRSWS